ncbi:hypothetical protein D3C77_184520 [compost metagenome]
MNNQPKLSRGDTDPVGDCGKFEAGIDVDDWLQRVVVYGVTPADAEALRDKIMTAFAERPALQTDLTARDERIDQLEQALRRSPCIGGGAQILAFMESRGEP